MLATMRRTLAVLIVPFVLLAACGDDDDGDGDAAGGCNVTTEQASTAVGLELVEADASFFDDGGGESCSWEYEHEDAKATVDVTWFEGTGDDAWEDAGAAYPDREEVDSVEGADEALYSAENSSLVARAGDDAVRVFVMGPDIILDDPRGAAEAIAEAAIAKG